MDMSIRRLTIAEEADAAARIAVQTSDGQEHNPYPVGTPAHDEFHRRYCIALLRLTMPEGAEGSA